MTTGAKCGQQHHAVVAREFCDAHAHRGVALRDHQLRQQLELLRIRGLIVRHPDRKDPREVPVFGLAQDTDDADALIGIECGLIGARRRVRGCREPEHRRLLDPRERELAIERLGVLGRLAVMRDRLVRMLQRFLGAARPVIGPRDADRQADAVRETSGNA